MKLAIESISVDGRFRKDHGDIAKLADSIATIGLLHPVIVSTEHKLICGERRLMACKSLDFQEIDATVVDLEGEDELIAQQDENETAKPFTVSERVDIARAIEAAIGNRSGQRTDLGVKPLQNFGEVGRGTTVEVAAKRAGFGNPQTYRQAKVVVDEGVAELVSAVDEGKVAVSTAAEIAKAPAKTQRKLVAQGKKAMAQEAARRRTEKRASRPRSRVVSAVVQQPEHLRFLALWLRNGAKMVTDFNGHEDAIALADRHSLYINPDETRIILEFLTPLYAEISVEDNAA